MKFEVKHMNPRRRKRHKDGLLTIGEIAKEFGILSSQVRYYTRLSLLKEASRTQGRYRLYKRDETIKRLKAILQLKKQGLSLVEITKRIDKNEKYDKTTMCMGKKEYISINRILAKLQEFIGYLKRFQKHSVEELKNDHTLQGAALQYLQWSIECVLDIGKILINQMKLRNPEKMHDIVNILADNHIIPNEFAQHFISIVRLRNILIYEYDKIDLDKIHNHLQNDLEDFDFYARKVAEFIQGLSGGS